MTRNVLRTGEVVAPGNWGAVIRQHGATHGSWQRENVLEQIRSADFPAKPTRFEAAFAFTDLNSATWWWHHERRTDFVYEVEVVEIGAASHIGDLLGVQMIAGVDASPEDAARRYWSQGPRFKTSDGVFIDELVTLSPLRVVGEIEMSDVGG